ncbi:membrane protein [Hylemonella gracilis str. Niagara R]|uniref:Outer membrane lipoprotein Blc n=1 Tax=Hylemonella gracilis str. Niagara R TaxID=1458275 RepID=A0A016XI92_9BURK|nr:lipocalin family protein [Hylemonella gracilis]EYC50938.1 membrane protein [Hylemonella gracilis str. Niagara R]
MLQRLKPLLATLGLSGLVGLLAGCQSSPVAPMPTVPQVDLPRFMGDWYVIANIPTFIERGAHNAVESYRLDTDGTIATTFRFRADAFDGPEKVYNPRGFVLDASNALWGMRFVWPIKADYRITYLDANYSQTVIARQARDYVWIMARTPSISEADYATLVRHVTELGYDVNRLQKVPQRWPAAKEQ